MDDGTEEDWMLTMFTLRANYPYRIEDREECISETTTPPTVSL